MFDLSRIMPYLPFHGCVSVPGCHEPGTLLSTTVSSVTRFAYLGIKTGAHLVFDLAVPFEEGQPSCFVDMTEPEEPQLRMDTTLPEGCEYVGRLIQCINHYN